MRNANKMTLLGAMLMTAVSAQAFNVKGTIVDKTTKEPLIGATIQIEVSAHNNKCRTKRRTGHRTCSRYSDHGGSHSYSPEESGK